MRRSKIFNPADMPTWWFILSAFLFACFFVGMVFLFALRFHLIRLAHADEHQQQWLDRYTVHPHAGEYPIIACSAGPDPSCDIFWMPCRHLADNPDDGLVSGRTPQVCAPPEAPRYPPGAGRGLLDPQQPQRSFAR